MLLADLALRPEAQQLIDEYPASGSPKAVFLKTDVAEWKQLEAMFDKADGEFGDIDLVCPGAGIFEPHWSNFWQPPGSERSKDAAHGDRYALVDINITHPMRTTQLAISYFLSPGKRGSKASATNPKRVVHVSSVAGETAGITTPMYFASKHAVSGFIYSLASLEPSLSIRVNGVAPGLIRTPLWTEHPEKIKYLDSSPYEWATPEEVAEAMLSCVEDDDVPGGTVLEVGHGNRRKVPLLNNPGPPNKPGLTLESVETGVKEVFDWLAEPGWGKVASPE